ncbi:putative aquaporin-12B isoform X2 [Equus asinus]|uniref:putative aquaporin-12B isoform X2 n=1 Tax=Equus asinus TaxID=9793 RepID=UPI0038F64605
MAGLNVSLCFFFATFALCQAARRVSKALLPAGAYASFAREAAGAAQLGACCLEMRMLVELGPWARGFGPDLLLTLLFLLFLVHGATFDGASANPAVSLQELLLAEAPLLGTLLKLAAQGLGMQAACVLTRLYWSWELNDLHVLQNLMAEHCSSALSTTVPHGTLVEGACAFFFHLTLLRFRNSLPIYRVPAVALLVTVMAYIGMVLAVLLYHGHLPRLFQRNLFYSQKSKYRVPRGKPAPGPGDTQMPAEGCRGREPGRRGVGQQPRSSS